MNKIGCAVLVAILALGACEEQNQPQSTTDPAAKSGVTAVEPGKKPVEATDGQTDSSIERASPAEAKAMAVRAANYLRSEGRKKAFAAFEQRGGPFHNRDLYVFVVDDSGTNVAQGFQREKWIGKNLINFKDPDGKRFVREFLAVKDEGWVDYKIENPLTHKIEEKTSYVVRVVMYVVGVGAYKQQPA